MTKDVLITIKGLQSLEAGSDPEEVEMVAKGSYICRDGRHLIYFNEMIDGLDKPTKNSIKVSDKSVTLKRWGAAQTEMIFEENKKTLTYYTTPFGTLELGISAAKINIEEQQESMDINIDYALEINAEHAADCRIHVNVKSKTAGNFSLSCS